MFRAFNINSGRQVGSQPFASINPMPHDPFLWAAFRLACLASLYLDRKPAVERALPAEERYSAGKIARESVSGHSQAEEMGTDGFVYIFSDIKLLSRNTTRVDIANVCLRVCCAHCPGLLLVSSTLVHTCMSCTVAVFAGACYQTPFYAVGFGNHAQVHP